jgi:hypothetical protein
MFPNQISTLDKIQIVKAFNYPNKYFDPVFYIKIHKGIVLINIEFVSLLSQYNGFASYDKKYMMLSEKNNPTNIRMLFFEHFQKVQQSTIFFDNGCRFFLTEPITDSDLIQVPQIVDNLYKSCLKPDWKPIIKSYKPVRNYLKPLSFRNCIVEFLGQPIVDYVDLNHFIIDYTVFEIFSKAEDELDYIRNFILVCNSSLGWVYKYFGITKYDCSFEFNFMGTEYDNLVDDEKSKFIAVGKLLDFNIDVVKFGDLNIYTVECCSIDELLHFMNNRNDYVSHDTNIDVERLKKAFLVSPELVNLLTWVDDDENDSEHDV